MGDRDLGGAGCPDTPTNKATASLGSHDRGLSLLHALSQPYPKQYVDEVESKICRIFKTVWTLQFPLCVRATQWFMALAGM